jgi:tRNA splicing endonuclease
MPVRKVKSGYKYGTKGKVYSKKSKAVKQGQAIKASQKKKK